MFQPSETLAGVRDDYVVKQSLKMKRADKNKHNKGKDEAHYMVHTEENGPMV